MMKKTLLVSLCLASLAAMAAQAASFGTKIRVIPSQVETGVAGSAACASPHEAAVYPITFACEPVVEAVERIVSVYGYAVKPLAAIDPSLCVTAEAVQGRLGDVLSELAAATRTKIYIDGCAVNIGPNPSHTRSAEAPAPDAEGPLWTLEAGKPIHAQLEAWAKTAGWTFKWRPSVSWVVPASVVFRGSFDEALEQVVSILYEEGKPLKLKIWEGNKVAEVSDADSV